MKEIKFHSAYFIEHNLLKIYLYCSVIVDNKNQFFSSWVWFPDSNMIPISLSIHSSVDTVYFHILASVNDAAMSIGCTGLEFSYLLHKYYEVK